jgi:hypothetical protein
MKGVLGLIMSPQRQLISDSKRVQGMSLRAIELRMAMEILSEVFGINVLEVEEMLLQRCKEEVQSCNREKASWPESFSLE